MKRQILSLACFVTLSATSLPAHAASQMAVGDLLAQGYEVKATSVVSADDSKAAFTNGAAPVAQILVTLQRGSSMAVCEFNWGTWGTLASTNSAQYAAKDRCDVVP